MRRAESAGQNPMRAAGKPKAVVRATPARVEAGGAGWSNPLARRIGSKLEDGEAATASKLERIRRARGSGVPVTQATPAPAPTGPPPSRPARKQSVAQPVRAPARTPTASGGWRAAIFGASAPRTAEPAPLSAEDRLSAALSGGGASASRPAQSRPPAAIGARGGDGVRGSELSHFAFASPSSRGKR